MKYVILRSFLASLAIFSLTYQGQPGYVETRLKSVCKHGFADAFS
jgi:hypothetical protein